MAAGFRFNRPLAVRIGLDAAETHIMVVSQIIKTQARFLVPVDTGRLRDSISIDRKAWNHYRVGTNVEYAPFVEFGTRFMAAQPYLTPAYKYAAQAFKRYSI